jgi:hypothetical protein
MPLSQQEMTMFRNAVTHTTNDHAATQELSIEELDSVAGGTFTLKGFVASMAAGAVAGACVGAAAGGVGAGPGAAGGAAAGGIAYMVNEAINAI